MRNIYDEQLRKLLQLKRFEQPSDDFWPAFEAGFQSKRLGILLEKSFGRRLREWLQSSPRSLLAGLGLACAICTAFLWPFGPVRAWEESPREYFMLTVANDVNDGVLIEENFEAETNSGCCISTFRTEGRSPRILVCKF
ncbi:MAG: hypothetical protein LBC42_01680 [Puniceicoccales bacterium]|jgi:hypothetical protein|nr:hypothetical protein [Puniceicoccales bacterium]